MRVREALTIYFVYNYDYARRAALRLRAEPLLLLERVEWALELKERHTHVREIVIRLYCFHEKKKRAVFALLVTPWM